MYMTPSKDKEIRIPGPDHPITISPAEGKIRVTVAGRTVAESTQALRLDEDGYPPVYYLPREAADMSLLVRTERIHHVQVVAIAPDSHAIHMDPVADIVLDPAARRVDPVDSAASLVRARAAAIQLESEGFRNEKPVGRARQHQQHAFRAVAVEIRQVYRFCGRQCRAFRIHAPEFAAVFVVAVNVKPIARPRAHGRTGGKRDAAREPSPSDIENIHRRHRRVGHAEQPPPIG